MDNISIALQSFKALIEEQLNRIEVIKNGDDFVDFKNLNEIVIGVVDGDGIGPEITKQAQRVLEVLLKDDISAGKIVIKEISGLTIENRIKHMTPIPSDVLEKLKQSHVILKGPTTTPRAGDGMPNIESANVAMRKELDLFANVRPVRIPESGIDWTFFRENTEGAYAVGNRGIEIDSELAFDFTVTTSVATERIVRAAFEFARNNNKTRVTAVTKANVIKTTDGKFLKIFKEVAKDYPEIQADDWYIDIMTAKLVDNKRRTQFQVMVLPNLYGDILTDEAAEFQGGVGTAGSANIGKRYAMFEAIHGSAPRMVEEGRSQFADPCSILRAAALLLNHIGYTSLSNKLNEALDICTITEKKLVITGRSDGATSKEFAEYVLSKI